MIDTTGKEAKVISLLDEIEITDTPKKALSPAQEKLRDQFAMAALPEVYKGVFDEQKKINDETLLYVSVLSYRIADAMLWRKAGGGIEGYTEFMNPAR